MPLPFGSTPAQASAITAAVHMLLTSPTTTTTVAKGWNAEGHCTAPGNLWRSLSVKRTLRGPMARRIVGERIHDALLARLSHDALRPPHPSRIVLGVGCCGVCGSRLEMLTPSGRPVRLVCTARVKGHAKGTGLHVQIKEQFVLDRVREGVIEIISKHGARLVDYEPLPLPVIASRIGALDAERRALDNTPMNEPVRRRIDAEVELLEGEHRDRLFADAMSRLDGADRKQVAGFWDALPIGQQRIVANALLYVEVGLGGRGPSRVRVESRVDA